MTEMILWDAIDAMPRAGLARHRFWHRIVVVVRTFETDRVYVEERMRRIC